jgi:hypothetical protein
MSTRNKLLLLLSFLIVALLGAVIAGSDRDRSEFYRPSTYSPGPGGAKGLYLMLKELGLPVTQFRLPFDRLRKQRGTLVVIEPDVVNFGKEEVKQLRSWVKKGNRLVIFEGGERKRFKIPFYTALDKQKLLRSLTPQSLAAKFGINKKKKKGDASRSVTAVNGEHLFGVGTLSVSDRSRWRRPPEEWTSWVADKRGPIVVSRKMGKGEVVAVSDASMLSNRFIQLEQNVRLLPAILLEKKRPQKILFDEYHHGHFHEESIGTYFSSSIFGLLFVQALVGCLLFFYARRAGNVGRYRSLSRPAGRSSLEYVDSMANLLESAKADSVALEAVLRRFMGRLARRSGVPVTRLDENSLHTVGIRLPEGTDPAHLIRECRRAIEFHESSERISLLAREVAQMQSKLFIRPRKEAKWRRSE